MLSKPFLILQLRPEDEASQNEFEAILKHGGLHKDEVVRIRMDQELPKGLLLDDYAGVIVGGGPSNASDTGDHRLEEHQRFDDELKRLLQEVIARDIPYLGICFGLGALTVASGGVVSKERYGETTSAIPVTLTEEGKQDALLVGLPETFQAFVGHKEACQVVPPGAVLLASGEACPIQMLRFGKHVYATQFHPELDVEGITIRVEVYRHAGYFLPEDADRIIAEAREEVVTVPIEILKRFIEQYRSV